MGGMGALVILWCYGVLIMRRDIGFILCSGTYGRTVYSPVSNGNFTGIPASDEFLVSQWALGWSLCGLDLHAASKTSFR